MFSIVDQDEIPQSQPKNFFIAAENLVGYSSTQPSLFKRNNLEPVKDLKLLVKDFAPIAHNALTILINISDDKDVLKNIASDDVFRETLLQRITVCQSCPIPSLPCSIDSVSADMYDRRIEPQRAQRQRTLNALCEPRQIRTRAQTTFPPA